MKHLARASPCSDPQLVEMIQNISAFQEDGKFSKQRYEELLRGQGMSPRTFEARVRQELMRQQLIAPYSENGFVSDTVAEKLMRLSEEKREISLVQILPAAIPGASQAGRNSH